MAGSASAATVLGIIGAGIGAAGTGYAVYSGQKQNATQQTALKKQNTAQQTATAAALSTERKGAIAPQTAPDLSNILQRAATAGKGLSSTMLTGPGGVDTSSLNLGKSTLLGA